MTIEKIKSAYSATPFKPFTLHLADGRVMSVAHPEFMAMMPGGRTIFVALDDGSYHIIDLLMVVSIGFESRGKGRSAGNRRRAG
ncbi:MAG: hypothetical protein KF699_12530 [Phycisphaeraceae bacterium]|nr:hypothetical protein [Phycisphaeraceae bacterium]MBX3406906.1 hypothetical protein [Phycisphaeraceae bacterium]